MRERVNAIVSAVVDIEPVAIITLGVQRPWFLSKRTRVPMVATEEVRQQRTIRPEGERYFVDR